MEKTPPNEVTQVVRRNILQGHESDYDAWLRRFITALQAAPGYLSTTVIVPSENPSMRYILHRFTDTASMEAWEGSETRSKLLKEVNKYSSPYYEKATGLETWFAIPGMHAVTAPPRWKMALVTFLAAYLLSFFANLTLNPILVTTSLPVSNLIITLILVIGLTYFLMPAFSRLLRRWLYPT